MSLLPSIRRFYTFIFIALLGAGFSGSARAGQSLSLSWDANPDTNTLGYHLYIGTNSGSYGLEIDVGTNTTVTLTGLQEGTTNYFAVSTYNSARMESAPSPAITFIIPGLLVLTPPATAGGAPGMTFPVAPGHAYEVEASVDLANWSVIWQTTTMTVNTWVTFQDPQAASYPKRFYRLIMQ